MILCAPSSQFKVDENMLSWYDVPSEPAVKVCRLMHSQFEHGNPDIQMGLTAMTNGMGQKIHEMVYLKNQVKQLDQTAVHFSRLCEEKQEENEKLMIETQSAHKIQVIAILCSCLTHLTFYRQFKLKETEMNYEKYVEETRTDVQDLEIRLDQAKTEFNDLKKSSEESKDKLLASESKNINLEAKLTSSVTDLEPLTKARGLFKDAESFPVMQTNGHLVDFHKIMEIWCKKADEDENHSLRTYICPFTSTHTNLAQFPVMLHTQNIASALGFNIEPPVAFEVEKMRVQLSLKTQIQLSARICYLYANRKKYGDSGKTSSVAADLENMVVVFRVSKVHTLLF
jgi:DNA gyrase/topoisomerase IV subunit A